MAKRSNPNERTSTRTHDSEGTKRKILAAVGAVLAEAGFSAVGINAVAREAGVDKVLIYRYFGGLPELLRAYSSEGDFWPTIRELLGGDLLDIARTSLPSLAVAFLRGHLRALRSRPRTQEIMRWELQEANELTAELARAREQQGHEIMRLLPIPPRKAEAVDLAAMAAVLHAGLTYLVLRSKSADVYLGVDLRSDAGWKRIELALDRIISAVLSEESPKGDK